MPSLQCNLTCNHCMYNCSPQNTTTLNYEDYLKFNQTIEWNKVSAFGFYGGEPSILISQYKKYVDLVLPQIIKFLITNGSWSLDHDKARKFLLDFCEPNNIRVMVSGTPQHKQHQDLIFLKYLNKFKLINLKGDDHIHYMGRARNLMKDNGCTNKCLWQPQPIRAAVFPTGHIIFQNCDGAYPIIGHINNTSFNQAFERATYIRKHTCQHLHPNINDIIDELSCKS